MLLHQLQELHVEQMSLQPALIIVANPNQQLFL